VFGFADEFERVKNDGYEVKLNARWGCLD